MVEIQQKISDKTLEDTFKIILELLDKAKKIKMGIKSISFYKNHAHIEIAPTETSLNNSIMPPKIVVGLTTYKERGNKIDIDITLSLNKMKDEYRELIDYILCLDK